METHVDSYMALHPVVKVIAAIIEGHQKDLQGILEKG